MRITCRNCGGEHPVWDCKRPATKSTASGKDRIIVGAVKASKPNLRSVPEGVDALPGKRNAIEAPAGTQALPVDTNPADGFEVRPPSSSKSDRGEAPDRRARDKDDQPIPKRKVGRPKFITDLKAYKAMKQKEYRKKWKERENDTKLG